MSGNIDAFGKGYVRQLKTTIGQQRYYKRSFQIREWQGTRKKT